MKRFARASLAALLALATNAACIVAPIRESEDDITISIEPEQFVIVGDVSGRSERFRVFSFGFGKRPSFLEAERFAYESLGADALVNRTRTRVFEGLVVPASWLAAIGVEGAIDVPIAGYEVYAVSGTALTIPAWEETSE